MATPKDSFAEYRQLILAALERLEATIAALNVKLDDLRNKEVQQLHVEVAMLKVRSTIFGAVGGSIGGAIVGALVARFLK